MRRYLALICPGFFETLDVENRLGQGLLEGVIVGLEMADLLGSGVAGGYRTSGRSFRPPGGLGPASVDRRMPSWRASSLWVRALSPSRTILIFSSTENFLRVALRIWLTISFP